MVWNATRWLCDSFSIVEHSVNNDVTWHDSCSLAVDTTLLSSNEPICRSQTNRTKHIHVNIWKIKIQHWDRDVGYWHQKADERHDNPPQGNQELLVVKDKVGRPPGELGVSKSMEYDNFPSVLWHCWLGDRKGIRPVKSWVLLVCWWWQFDWSFARLIPPLLSSTASIKPGNPGSPGKMAVKTVRDWDRDAEHIEGRRGERNVRVHNALCRTAASKLPLFGIWKYY